MKISEVLQQLRGFTDYIKSLDRDCARNGPQAFTRWDYILSVYGPAPCLFVWGQADKILNPLRVVFLGWDGCHENSLWSKLPREEEVMAGLELTPENYAKLEKAIYLSRGYHPILRRDLIAAVGFEPEENSPWFTKTVREQYPNRSK